MSRKQQQRKKMVKQIPWKKRKGERNLRAFARQATSVALRDQTRLIGLGYKPIDAAIEAWLTMEASDS